MNQNGKQLSNPFSTGGGGVHFETHVQASFGIKPTGGFAFCMPYLAYYHPDNILKEI